MGTKDLTHEAIADALSHDRPLTHEQRGVLLGLVIDDKKWQREYDCANALRIQMQEELAQLGYTVRAGRLCPPEDNQEWDALVDAMLRRRQKERLMSGVL